ncbi:hypothetical protein O1D97_03670 [Marinomonas sp. 15G1-11]|uniref:HTH marR-type domain-containing protein n=1 Tax=Marinomonas phaeophyticola TaxID=3004091 RepID=A0ABT4JQZ1_9GAMM|nr:hypothetical protein [Marinomonas sp. 15G1-11]
MSRFEKEGLIIRNRSPQDQRITLLSLSDQAKEVFEEISPKVDLAYERLTKKLGKEKMKALSLLLKYPNLNQNSSTLPGQTNIKCILLMPICTFLMIFISSHCEYN